MRRQARRIGPFSNYESVPTDWRSGIGASLRKIAVFDAGHLHLRIEARDRISLWITSGHLRAVGRALLMLNHDLGTERHARIEVDHIVIDEPEAA